jgi:hypothetical protein
MSSFLCKKPGGKLKDQKAQIEFSVFKVVPLCKVEGDSNVYVCIYIICFACQLPRNVSKICKGYGINCFKAALKYENYSLENVRHSFACLLREIKRTTEGETRISWTDTD